MSDLPMEKTTEATVMYIRDFVHMSHNALCLKEEEVIAIQFLEIITLSKI